MFKKQRRINGFLLPGVLPLVRSALELDMLGQRERAVEAAKGSLVIWRQIESPGVAKVEAWLRKRDIEV